MKLFGFGKKTESKPCCESKTTPCCEPKNVETSCCGGKTAEIIVLGDCCKKSSEAFAHTKQAASELGLGCVQQIGDPTIIASYGVMSTPALVIKGAVVSYGKAISVADAKALLQQHFN